MAASSAATVRYGETTILSRIRHGVKLRTLLLEANNSSLTLILPLTLTFQQPLTLTLTVTLTDPDAGWPLSLQRWCERC